MRYFSSCLAACLLMLNVTAQSGITWQPIQTIASSYYSNDHPRITLDGQGNPLVIWGHNSGMKAWFARWNGSSFSTPVTLHHDSIHVFASNWAGPDIASKGDTVYAVFKRTPEDDYPIQLVSSFNGGVSFSAPVPVENIGTDISRFPTLAVDANGNPLVAFMRFNSSWSNSRWTVSRSANLGATFSADKKASGFGSGAVCDCCPGALVYSDNKVAMLYRDENSNIRDMWAGISTNNGDTFATGIGIDGSNWMLMSCPSSGPDGVIVGDTLYSVFMSGASGKTLVYRSKASLSAGMSVTRTPITGNFTGLTNQNYPRIDAYGSVTAMVWKQQVQGGSMVAMAFTKNIRNGMPPFNDTVKFGGYTGVFSPDVAVTKDAVHVVWEDDSTGTVKYRKGTYSLNNNSIAEAAESNARISVYPNPAGNELHILIVGSSYSDHFNFSIVDMLGREVGAATSGGPTDISALPSGMYYLKGLSPDGPVFKSFIKQ